MPSKLDVMNFALTILEEPPLVSPDQAGHAAIILRANYESAVAKCLEKAPWNFGVTRVQLTRLSETPAFSYTYYYAKPADCMRILSCHDIGYDTDGFTDWRDEDGKIASNAETMYMRYVRRDLSTNPGAWPQCFADYVSADLAVRVGPRIKTGDFNYQVAKDSLEMREGDALAFDAAQSPPKRWNQGRWLRSQRTLNSRWGQNGRG